MEKCLFFLVATILFLQSSIFAQEIQWQNTIGGNSNEEFFSIQQTSDGGYILGGYTAGVSSNYFNVKTDSSGIIQWQNTIGGSGFDALTSIKQTMDGGYILGGSSESNISGDKTENSNGYADYWIVKTDSSGNIQWQNTIGGDLTDFLFSTQQTADGGYILGGYSNSNISGDKTEDNYGDYNYWILKTDGLGTIEWQNTIGGNGGYDALRIIKQTTDGGYILGGYSNSNISGDKTEDCMGDYDYWIVKTDTSGVIQWQNTIGGSADDQLYSLQETSDGGYILGGYSNSDISGDKIENSKGDYDYWIVKTDTAGVIQWQNTIGGSNSDNLMSVYQTTDGGLILGGYSLSNISGDKTETCYSGNDYWIIKTDTAGIIQWQNTIGGSADDQLYSLQETSDGGYILGGKSMSNISGDKTENRSGASDFWIVKLTNYYNGLTGKLFIDTNNNNLQESGEPSVVNKKVTELNTGRYGISVQNGNYTVSVLDSGIYTVSPLAINYYTTVPATHSAIFTGIQQTDSLNDFAFQPSGVFNDLCVTITPLGPFRARFNASYQINYENVGTTILNPTVIFFPDNDISLVSSIPTATTVATDSLVWDFGPLTPFQQGSILITVNVNTGTPIGTLINSSARIEPVAGDANTICNQSYWEVLTTGSFDPNDIVVDQDTLLTTQFPMSPYLEYIIRFQNTGNDTAFTVKVLNPVDTNFLDLSSFEFVTASHPVDLNWINWEKNMYFQFDNILLPDSNVNEPASHGFVRYRIKPKSTLIVGDSITNNAAIYFDFNAPVITNTAVTRIVLPTSINESIAIFDNMQLYPNPANSILFIESGNISASGSRIIITDVAGRTIFSKPITSATSKHNLNISYLSQGTYFVQLQAGDKISRGRFVKN